jgi:psiF repeat
MPMLRILSVISLLPLLLLATPASAITAKAKMETCKVGADNQGLKGAKRTAFIGRCMGKGNYKPPARKLAKKPAHKKTMAKKPAPKPMTQQPAPAPKQ